jgi:predicted amidohydrolase YtcJ
VILHGGTVRSGDERLPRSTAVAIAGDRIAGGVDVREGERSQVSGERFDLDGRCVVPGFCDSHVHFLEWALALRQLDLSGTASRAEALERVHAVSPGAPDEWLIGHGWRDGHWPAGDAPDRASLDAACPGRPCALMAHDHHTLWVNGAALARLGVPDAPVVERDARGEPTGVLREHAAWRLWGAIPIPGEEERDEIVRAAMREAHRRGVTGVHDFQRDGGLGAWQRLHADRRLTLRVWASLPADRLDEALELELRSGFGDDWLQIGPVKAFADGTLGSRTAAMLSPFADGGTGLELLGREELTQLVLRATAGGLDVAVHAIGDAANRTVLDAFEETASTWQAAGRRPRIEHAQLLDPHDLPRFAALGVTASVQPSHAPSDRLVAEAAWDARCETAYAYGSLARSGAPLCFGSDAPIEPVSPLAGAQAAATRDWPADEALPNDEALAGFWSGAARARHAEQASGRLLPGFLADLCVLDRDPLECPPDELGGIEVVATMAGGRWVHGRPPW